MMQRRQVMPGSAGNPELPCQNEAAGSNGVQQHFDTMQQWHSIAGGQPVTPACVDALQVATNCLPSCGRASLCGATAAGATLAIALLVRTNLLRALTCHVL
eukprot:GHUV01018662.1.p2 GENE.GHUV01018662.1~~GHUV01018662.1.p2  ORF type:complete len:101 (+),score=24.62 GHUV01018662.1:729-1031(+)